MTNRSTTPTPPPVRGTPAAYARVAALAAAALSVAGIALVLHAAFRPLPVAGPADTVPPPRPIDLPVRTTPLEDREQRLAELNERNLFTLAAEDWFASLRPDPNAPATDAANADPQNPNAATNTPGATAADTPANPSGPARRLTAYDRIPITEKPPADFDKEFKKISLMGVIEIAGTPAAMLENRNTMTGRLPERPIAQAGQTFGDGDWTLTAIDTQGYRVIVSRDGVNAELQLFEGQTLALAAAQETPGPVADRGPRPTEFRLERATEADVRAALSGTNLRSAEIDALLDAVNRGIAIAGGPAPATSTPAARPTAEPLPDDAAAALRQLSEDLAGPINTDLPAPNPTDDPSQLTGINAILQLLSSDPTADPTARTNTQQQQPDPN